VEMDPRGVGRCCVPEDRDLFTPRGGYLRMEATADERNNTSGRSTEPHSLSAVWTKVRYGGTPGRIS
jgi:hypothetical protein